MTDKLGPTGQFPQGKIHESDEGQCRIGVGADLSKGVVVIDFGSPCAWFAMPREEAIQFAHIVIEQANKLPVVQ